MHFLEASRKKHPRVRSGSRGPAPLHRGLFLAANLGTDMQVKPAIFEADVLPLPNLIASLAISTDIRMN